MRISVIDVGSNTVRLVVADAEGGVPLPVHTAKWKLRLSEQVEPDGTVPEQAVQQLVMAVCAAARKAQHWGAAAPLSFATAVVRNAPNRLDVLRTVRTRTGIRICTLPGEAEAELTFLGARRWMGWRAGPLAMLDIGGGSLEVAFGRGRLPDFAVSLSLGANRLTREFLVEQDPPCAESVRALRRRIRHQLRDVASRIRWEAPHTTVATSRTFEQLGRLCGAPPGRQGPFVPRHLTRKDLRGAVDRLAVLPSPERAQLAGISAPRAEQSLAGALVGHTAMKLMGITEVSICPWGIREGILLRHMEEGSTWWSELIQTLDEGDAPLRLAEPAR
ncbi:Ppx/GppA family phosphatase [Streptomyces antnestii]|uniref:Ppx/GppA family phosphatase n=1 Tax=Streptomyces antnestii TaxID=2494256 RepID=A0A3S2VUB2_9ACTN|nr:Ppx/GppA family phosphatase [Streptomyces sp. San01]RVU17684.1 Ppx/GppA family phosphatase [Streptomyces sp. San01]